MKGGLDLTQDIAMEVFTAALVLALKLGLPVLIAAVVIGLIIAILQAATQVHEQTLSFAPKAIVVAIVLLLFGPWMMNSCKEFFNYIFGLMATVGAT